MLALLLAAASPELEIVGITTVSGNVPADMGAGNARKALAQAGRLDIPVYIGEMVPLKGKYVDAMDTHGSAGLGESFLPEIPGVFPEKSAVDFLEKNWKRKKFRLLLWSADQSGPSLLKRPEWLTGFPGWYPWEEISKVTELFSGGRV